MRENHYAISCIVLKISYVFNKQDEHNASNYTKMFWTGFNLSNYKSNENLLNGNRKGMYREIHPSEVPTRFELV